MSSVHCNWLMVVLICSCLVFRCCPHIGHLKPQLVRYSDPALIKGLIFVYFKGLDGGNGGTSSPFNPAMAAPSPSAVAQSGSSMAHIEQIRQVRDSLINYSGDLNTNHLNTRNIWIMNFLKFKFKIVRCSNGWGMCCVLCTRPTIQIPDQYLKKTRLRPFIWYSNGQAVRVFKWYLNTRDPNTCKILTVSGELVNLSLHLELELWVGSGV